MSSHRKNNGQVLVIILLVMIVGLTVGLFLLGRTTVDVSVSKNVEESARAFNAAEAGIEESIRDLTTVVAPPVPFAPGLTYQVGVQPFTVGASGFFPGTKQKPVKLNEVFNVWLVPHNESSGDPIETQGLSYRNLLSICFTGGTPEPAIQVTVHYKEGPGAPKPYSSVSTGFDPDSSRGASNHLKPIDSLGACNGAAPNNYNHQVDIDFATDFGVDLTQNGNVPYPLVIRITPLYVPASLAVIPDPAATPPFPKQGNEIESTGHSGDIARTIEVAEQYLVPAPWLDQALYVAGGAGVTK